MNYDELVLLVSKLNGIVNPSIADSMIYYDKFTRYEAIRKLIVDAAERLKEH